MDVIPDVGNVLVSHQAKVIEQPSTLVSSDTKDKDDEFRLMGFGHRVYKNFDPRAKIIKVTADEVLNDLGVVDPILDIAKGLEQDIEAFKNWREEFKGKGCGQVFLHYNKSSSKKAKDFLEMGIVANKNNFHIFYNHFLNEFYTTPLYLL